MRLVTAALLAFVVLASAGCSDDPPANPASGAHVPALVFEPGPEAASPAVSLRGVEVSNDRVVLDVVGHDLPSLYGVAFRLRYEPSVLAAIEMKPAPAWSKASGLSAAREGAPGLLVAGLSASGAFAGMHVGGDTLATLTFDLAAPSPTPIDFVVERSLAESADDGSIAGVTWVGGALVVR